MSTTENQGNTYELPLEAFLARINRHLKRLIPSRELFYDFGRRNYFIRVVNQGQPNHLETQGPYYYVQMVGLARMIGVVSRAERAMPSITLKTRGGSVYQEQVLPSHLKFDVLTPVLYDAICQLRERGYDVTKRAAPVTAPASVTSAVTEPEVTDPAEEYDETLGFDIDPETGEVTAR